MLRFDADDIIDSVAGEEREKERGDGRANARNWNGKGAFAYAKLGREKGEKMAETK